MLSERVRRGVGRLRFQRFLTSRDWPKQLPGTCAACDGPLPGRRRRWCSDECEREFLVRYSGTVVAEQVARRDKGICAKCGMDCGWLWSEYRRIRRAAYDARASKLPGRWGPWRPSAYGMWEADHIVPVSQGGGCCGLENYRTLCLRCHKEETAALAREAAERRKDERLGMRMGL